MLLQSKLPDLVLGTAQLGLNYGIMNKGQLNLDKRACFDLLDFAWDQGIRALDTAFVYGDAHSLITEYISQNKSKRFQILTKIKSTLEVAREVKKFKEEIGGMLKAVYVHDSSLLSSELLTELKALMKEGDIESIALSLYSSSDYEKVAASEFTRYQLPLNLFDNFSKRSQLIKAISREGKTVAVRSVFLQGVLLSDQNLPSKLQLLKTPLRQMNEIAIDYGLSMEELSLRYVLSFSEVSEVILGVDSIVQLERNIEIFKKGALPQVILDSIHRIEVDPFFIDPRNWGKL